MKALTETVALVGVVALVAAVFFFGLPGLNENLRIAIAFGGTVLVLLVWGWAKQRRGQRNGDRP